MSSTDKKAVIGAVSLASLVFIAALAFAFNNSDAYLLTALPIGIVVAAIACIGGVKMLDRYHKLHPGSH